MVALSGRTCQLSHRRTPHGRGILDLHMNRRVTDFALIESMLFDGSLGRLEQHLQRLRSSAAELHFRFDEQRVLTMLDQLVSQLHGDSGRYKVRLLLERDGTAWTEAQPLGTDNGSDVMLASARLSSLDGLARHKTTRRDLFDRYAGLFTALNLYDVIFLNEAGEVAEASRSNVFAQFGDELLTPPADSGILAGVYRNWVLATRPEAREERLLDTDLMAADAIFLCNSVRGWRQVSLLPGRLRPD